MKLRSLTAIHAASIGMTHAQTIQLAKILGADDRTADDFQASGRGPGGGPDATAYSVTKLALAALADGLQSRAPAEVFALYSVAAAGNDSGAGEIVPDDYDPRAALAPLIPCAITGAIVFGDALVAILRSPALADRIDRIEVRRGEQDARIVARDGRQTRFVSDHDAHRLELADAAGALRVVATIGGGVLADIARDIAAG